MAGSLFQAPRESFPKKVIKQFKPSIEDVVEHLQGGTVPTRRSKRLSVGGSGAESDSNSGADGDDVGDDDDGNDDDGNDGSNDHDDNEDNSIEDDGNEEDGNEDDGIEDDYGYEYVDADADADADAEDGDVEGDGETATADQGGDDEDSEGSASIRPPKKKRRGKCSDLSFSSNLLRLISVSRTAGNRNDGGAFDNLGDSDHDGMDGDPFPATQTPPRSHRTFKGKENSAIYVPSSSPSSEQDSLWFNAANYEPKMPFLNLR